MGCHHCEPLMWSSLGAFKARQLLEVRHYVCLIMQESPVDGPVAHGDAGIDRWIDQ